MDDTASANVERVAADVAYLRDRIVNLAFVGQPGAGDREWTLVDAGLYGSADRIAAAAAALFGPAARPAAIVLTHGHFDHVGALRTLADRWDAPVHAHELELPYITARSAYPPPDPTVGGGAMARLAGLYPRRPIDVRGRAHALPADGTVPGMPGWRWIHTPGHTPGHVSLYREADGALIVGDAFVTTKQESLSAVISQRREMHGPPAYFTPDWGAAKASVERLAALRPEIALTGHGRPMFGDRLRRDLDWLAGNFDRLAVPASGRYVHAPAVADERGVVSVPPPVADPLPKVLAVAAAAALGLAFAARRGRSGPRA